MTQVPIYGFIQDSNGDGVTGTNARVNVHRITKATLANSLVVSGVVASVIDGGFVGYLVTGADLNTYDYLGKFIVTGTSVLSRQLPALRWDGAEEHADEFVAMSADLATIISDIANLPTDVWANPVRTLTSYGTLIADIWSYATRTLTSGGGGGASAAEIWSYGNRSLTVPITPDQYAQLSNTDIRHYKGDTLRVQFTGLSLADVDDLIFTVKSNTEYSDPRATLQLRKDGGLIYLNGVTGTGTDGSIVVSGTSAWVSAKASVMSMISIGAYSYDLKKTVTGTVDIFTLANGDYREIASPTHSIA